LKGALVSIDAIATNAKIARTIKDAGADYLLAVEANQPTPRWPRSLQRINIEAEAVGRSLVRGRKQELSYGKPARTLSPMATQNFSRHHK
jgi:hypothetical protein